MKPKNCLIFGGTGQIGRNLVRKHQMNYQVTVDKEYSSKKLYFKDPS